uniref:Restriction alleviation protein n=1 Tax=Siphoviridae sp. ctckI12 TaxID=2825574 RepID=A0A8S5NYP3_9CAUD|nr:MAG TPA: restriction alleviation protein [Siphoviridae sp. ctckI12]
MRCNYCCIGTVLTKNEQDAIELWNHRTEVPYND